MGEESIRVEVVAQQYQRIDRRICVLTLHRLTDCKLAFEEPRQHLPGLTGVANSEQRCDGMRVSSGRISQVRCACDRAAERESADRANDPEVLSL